jgi:hypothetical protein
MYSVSQVLPVHLILPSHVHMTFGQNVEREAAPGEHCGSCTSSPVPNFLQGPFGILVTLRSNINILFKKNFHHVAPRVLAFRIASSLSVSCSIANGLQHVCGGYVQVDPGFIVRDP